MGRIPRSMRIAPRLDPDFRDVVPQARTALLINPFYPKDPHASFGKHVLTPTLALTSVAASTPPEWKARYWDENLLQGPPPQEPFPQVVGITVHLTFCERAYELARRGLVTLLPLLPFLAALLWLRRDAKTRARGLGVLLGLVGALLLLAFLVVRADRRFTGAGGSGGLRRTLGPHPLEPSFLLAVASDQCRSRTH